MLSNTDPLEIALPEAFGEFVSDPEALKFAGDGAEFATSRTEDSMFSGGFDCETRASKDVLPSLVTDAVVAAGTPTRLPAHIRRDQRATCSDRLFLRDRPGNWSWKAGVLCEGENLDNADSIMSGAPARGTRKSDFGQEPVRR